MKTAKVCMAIAAAIVLVSAVNVSADIVLYNFESFSDGALLGDGAVLDAGEVLKTFGLPIGNQSAPQVTSVNATTASSITLQGGSVSARFTADWSLDVASPFFAGMMLVNSQTDLSANSISGATIDFRSTGAGTSTLSLLINDGTTSYEHNAATIVGGDATYSFDFTNAGNWTFTDGNGATTYSQVLSNAQFIGFTLTRVGATSDIETVTFDNLTLAQVPEPATLVLLGTAMVFLKKPRTRRFEILIGS